MFRISQTQVAFRKYGLPHIWTLNTYYGYFGLTKTLTEAEYEVIRKGTEYTGPLHDAELKWRENLHLCG